MARSPAKCGSPDFPDEGLCCCSYCEGFDDGKDATEASATRALLRVTVSALRGLADDIEASCQQSGQQDAQGVDSGDRG